MSTFRDRVNSTPRAPRCDGWRSGRRCALPAAFLFVWEHRNNEALCHRHGGQWLAQSALPPSLLAIARWDPRHAKNGWLWDPFGPCIVH